MKPSKPRKPRAPRKHGNVWIHHDVVCFDRTSNTYDHLTARQARTLAAWLLRAADWLDAQAPARTRKAGR